MNIVFFDTETTGFDAETCRVIEIAAIRYEMENGVYTKKEDMDMLIRLPEGQKIPEKIVELTHITDEMLAKDGVDGETAANRFCDMMSYEKTILVAHNAQFDINFVAFMILRNCPTRIALMNQIDYLDSLTICKDRKAYPHKLEDMIRCYDIDAVNSHRAIDDVDALAKLFFALEKERDDVYEYVNVFGYNPKYGLKGKKFSKIRYLSQPYRDNMVTADHILPKI